MSEQTGRDYRLNATVPRVGKYPVEFRGWVALVSERSLSTLNSPVPTPLHRLREFGPWLPPTRHDWAEVLRRRRPQSARRKHERTARRMLAMGYEPDEIRAMLDCPSGPGVVTVARRHRPARGCYCYSRVFGVSRFPASEHLRASA